MSVTTKLSYFSVQNMQSLKRKRYFHLRKLEIEEQSKQKKRSNKN